jgi:hypothetical protein
VKSRSQPNIERAQSEVEDIRAGYQAAVQMVSYEGQKRWTSTTVFVQLSITLVAASLAPAFIPGLAQQASSVLGLLFSVLGLIASVIWLCLLLRYEKITLYWLLSARELEALMASAVKSFQRGKDFAAGDSVSVAGENARYERLERLPERWGLPIIYLVFILVFAALIWLNIYRVCHADAG